MDYHEKLKQSKNHLDRCAIASAKNCPIDLLEMFVKYETQIEVVEAAALNLLCTAEMIEIAASRFPTLLTDEFKNKRERRLQQYYHIILQAH